MQNRWLIKYFFAPLYVLRSLTNVGGSVCSIGGSVCDVCVHHPHHLSITGLMAGCVTGTNRDVTVMSLNAPYQRTGAKEQRYHKVDDPDRVFLFLIHFRSFLKQCTPFYSHTSFIQHTLHMTCLIWSLMIVCLM